jgi:hypothetical protein
MSAVAAARREKKKSRNMGTVGARTVAYRLDIELVHEMLVGTRLEVDVGCPGWTDANASRATLKSKVVGPYLSSTG